MVHRMQKRSKSRRKLHIHRSPSATKSVREWSIVTAALLLYIQKLKLKLVDLAREYRTLHAMHRQLLEYMSLLKSEVRVERIRNVDRPLFTVRVTCEKTEGRLLSILEAFEEMSLNVMQAKVSCNGRLFAMEAVVVAAAQEQPVAVTDVTRALIKAIEQPTEDEGKI